MKKNHYQWSINKNNEKKNTKRMTKTQNQTLNLDLTKSNSTK